MKNRAKPGDIFVEKLPNGQYMFGKVLLDIKEQCFKTKLVEKGKSELRHNDICYLVEVYDCISNKPDLPEKFNVVIKGVPVDPLSFEDDLWQVIGHQEVDPLEIDFSESIGYYNKEVTLYKGELVLEAKLDDDRLLFLPKYAALDAINLFNAVLAMLGKDELASRELDITNYDARFEKSGLRDVVYKALGEDPGISYYDLAKKHGFDTARFFKSIEKSKAKK